MTNLLPPHAPELNRQFQHFRYSVFRLETLQTYSGSGEDEGIAAFARGDHEPPPDPAEDEWAALLRANAAAGRTQQRVHVITEPITDYLAYELTWEYGPHVFAGEEIRIIPVTVGWPADVPTQDFWLFDSTILFDMHYDADGLWLGIEPVTDATRVAAACFARDAALHHSIPWRVYLARYPELERRLIPAWR